MRSLDDISVLYFIGIGGIGMSALARYFNSRGVDVHGYDRSKTKLTESLSAEGMSIHYDEDIAQIPAGVDLVIYTPAIPKDNLEFVHCQKEGLAVHKRAEVLGKISEDKFTIAIAGTHGKTTITSMIGHLLKDTEYDATAFIGGISLNYNSNFIAGTSDVFVVEADEYDRSFHHLHPDIAIVTAIDDDHLDIYGDRASLVAAYLKFIDNVKPNGLAILNSEIDCDWSGVNCSIKYYSEETEDADYYLKSINQAQEAYKYEVLAGEKLEPFKLNIGGTYNVLNTLPMIATGHRIGLKPHIIAEAVDSFSGIQRRFEFILKSNNRVFIDDYAHHPEEIRVLLESTRSLFPDRKMTVVFQPHLFSRTQDLLDGFVSSLSIADEVILLEIYPARELPIEGVSSERILEKLENGYQVIAKEKLVQAIQYLNPELLLTVGAGDIDTLIPALKLTLTDPN